ncbi:MAG: HAMP domain-containing histidine kinase [Spirochaetes bacterium]|nr:HAMP domain-containing histidine kinase [Spirochaetota bacterium]
MKINLLENNRIILIFIILLFIFINIFFFWVIKSEMKNQDLFIKFSLEKKISSLIEALRQNRINETIEMDKDLISFGFYDSDGTKIYSYKNAPENIITDFYLPSDDFFEKRNGIITLIRSIGPGGTFFFNPDMPRRMPHHMFNNPMMSRMMKFIYIQVKIENKRYLIIYSIIIELFLLTVFVIIIYFYRMNIMYRKNLEKQKELAKIGEISRTLAHEIKNPLGSIRLQTGYLKKVLPKKYSSELSIIDDEISRIKKLTEKIKEFLKDPIGSKEKIKIIDFINNIIKNYDYKIIFNFNENNYIINFDTDRLRSIIENIILNAIESSKEANTDSPVIINVIKEKDYIIISVLDSGIGLKTCDKEKLFDAFYTTKINGSGIGLAMVKRFIEASDGSVKIVQKKEGGVEVKLKVKSV